MARRINVKVEYELELGLRELEETIELVQEIEATFEYLSVVPEHNVDLESIRQMYDQPDETSVTVRPRMSLTADERRAMAESHAQGKTVEGLADEYRLTRTAVRAVIEEEGPPAVARSNGAGGRPAPTQLPDGMEGRKLTEDQVREARARHAAGMSAAALAREYPLGEAAMRRMLNRDSYADVE